MLFHTLFVTVNHCLFTHSGLSCRFKHYENTLIQYTVIFQGCKKLFSDEKLRYFSFAQNIDCGYTLEPEAVLMSTHNLCFGAKIRKNVYPCKPQFNYIKVGCKGVFIPGTHFHDGHVRR